MQLFCMSVVWLALFISYTDSVSYTHLDVHKRQGEDYNKVEKVLREIIANDKRILTSPAPFIELGELAASSVNIKIRV